MRSIILAIMLCATPVFAQVTTEKPPSEKPAKVNFFRHVTIEKDLKFTQVSKIEVEIFKREIIQNFSSLKFTFQEGSDKVLSYEAYNLKADGRKIMVAENKFITQNVAAANNTSTYTTDVISKTALYSDIEVGDKLVLDYKLASNAQQLPNFIGIAQSYNRNLYHEKFEFKYSYPKSLDLKFESVDFVKNIENLGEITTVTLKPQYEFEIAAEPHSIDSSQFRPRFYISNAKSYEEIGVAYYKLIDGKNKVTPEIKRLADKITKDIAGDKAKAAALYDWIIQNIHYVTINFGAGRIIPNSTEDILKNRYGDCKDVSVLFSALLKAVNIKGELVLIRANDIYNLSNTPHLGEFNHMIVYIPSLEIFADPTLKAGSLNELLVQLRDKPVLIVSEKNTRLMKTPAMKASENFHINSISLKIGEDGIVTGKNEMEGKGYAAIAFRQFSQAIEASNKTELIKRLQSAYVPLEKTDINFGLPQARGDILKASSEFTYENKAKVKENVRISNGLSNIYRPYLSLPDGKKPRLTDFLCISQGYQENITVELPLNYKFVNRPRNRSISNRYFDYNSNTVVEDNIMKITRQYHPKFESPVCDKNIAVEMRDDLEEMRLNLRATFTYAVKTSEEKKL